MVQVVVHIKPHAVDVRNTTEPVLGSSIQDKFVNIGDIKVNLNFMACSPSHNPQHPPWI